MLEKALLSAGLFRSSKFVVVKFSALLLFLLCALSVCISQRSMAQARPDTSLNTVISDSLRRRQLAGTVGSDTTLVIDSITAKLAFRPKPKKAALYSAMLPGAGQIYNRQAWKAPIVYVGMAASFYFLIDNTNKYREFRSAYTAEIDGDPSTRSEYAGRYTANDLLQLRDTYRQYLDMTVLVTTLGYTIQVLDALVYAHLRGFDVSEDISMKLGPVSAPSGVGFGLTARLR